MALRAVKEPCHRFSHAEYSCLCLNIVQRFAVRLLKSAPQLASVFPCGTISVRKSLVLTPRPHSSHQASGILPSLIFNAGLHVCFIAWLLLLVIHFLLFREILCTAPVRWDCVIGSQLRVDVHPDGRSSRDATLPKPMSLTEL